jgi:hypothetical protein
MEAVTADTPLGVVCLTCCPRCSGAVGHAAPPVSVATAARLAMEHCAHLGITIEDMSAMREDTSWGTGSGGRSGW